MQGIKHFLITRGLSNVWNNPTNYNCDNIVTQIKQKLSDEFNQIVQRESSKSQTLKDYLVIAERDNGKHPSYLNKISNPYHRSTLTKLRTQAHCLAIVADKYDTTVADEDKYLCKKCNAPKQEDVPHWLLDCTWSPLTEPRSRLINHIVRNTGHTIVSKSDILQCTLTCDFPLMNETQRNHTYKLLHELYRIREQRQVKQDQTRTSHST